jgi:hypothetical protein
MIDYVIRGTKFNETLQTKSRRNRDQSDVNRRLKRYCIMQTENEHIRGMAPVVLSQFRGEPAHFSLLKVE